MAKIKFKKTTLKSYNSLFQIVSNNKISTSRESERLFSFIDTDTIQIRKGSKPEENLMVAGRLIYNLPLTAFNKRNANTQVYNKLIKPIRNSYSYEIRNGFDASIAEKNASVRLTESLYSGAKLKLTIFRSYISCKSRRSPTIYVNKHAVSEVSA